MRKKSAYRIKDDAPEIKSEPLNIPVELLPNEDSLQREPEAPPAPAQQAEPQQEQEAKPQDDASAVLLSQIEALRHSEEIQRHRQEMAAADQSRAKWLRSTPLAQQHFAALGPLHHEALQAGLDDLSPEYFRHLESGLDALAQQQMSGNAMDEPRPLPAVEEAPTRMPAPPRVPVSAPVTRSIPSPERDMIETNPSVVKLSPVELEIARSAGISPVEYAKGKLKLEREKREGLRQG